jgi:RNA polymerase sigma factor (sigma-70 family)
MTDRQLLADYARSGDSEAFAEIVRRHSGMVYQACRRVLGDEHGAEDAAQATFLLLARKARKLPEKTVLSGWLFRAAQNSAMHLRREHARRARREKEAASMRPAGGGSRDELWARIEPRITGAIAALPARQRDAVVLRYVAGKAPADAAREMGCSQNSFSVSLSKAMAKLRRKLAGRGTALPAGTLAALLSAHAPAAAPEALTATITAACLGTASTSTSALSITEEVAGAMAWAKVKLAAAVLAAATVVAGTGGVAVHHLAAGGGSGFPVNLAPDPEVLRILDSLEAGQSAYLPPVRTAGDLNAVARKYGLDRTGPCGRNYTVKMVWMPDRRRAVFTGANHRIPHRLNDVWEYDLPSNTWVCLYGPDDIGTKQGWRRVRLVNGVPRTPRGGPAVVGNGEWQVTYAPELKAMLFNSTWSIHSKEIRQKYVSKSEHKPPLWLFRPETRKWEPVRCPQPAPGAGHAIYIDYLPAVARVAWVDSGHGETGMWLYDPVTNEFEKLRSGEGFKPRNDPNVPPSDGVAAYCPAKKILIVCSRGKEGALTAHFDVENRKWTRAASGPQVPAGHMSFTPCGYDTVGKVMLLYDQRDGTFWNYAPEKRKWEKIAARGPTPPPGPVKVIGYYDEARNAFVLCQREKVWVYRHRRASRGIDDG